MSMVKCATIRCQHYVRQGLRRHGRGVDGQALADGQFCWRCRARNDREPTQSTRRKSSKLTEAQWQQVFSARCKSKQGQAMSPEEHALVNAAYDEDRTRYGAMEPEVFNATVPFGSTVRWGDKKRRRRKAS